MGEWADSEQEKIATHNITIKNVQYGDCRGHEEENANSGEACQVRKH